MLNKLYLAITQPEEFRYDFDIVEEDKLPEYLRQNVMCYVQVIDQRLVDSGVFFTSTSNEKEEDVPWQFCSVVYLCDEDEIKSKGGTRLAWIQKRYDDNRYKRWRGYDYDDWIANDKKLDNLTPVQSAIQY